MASTVAGDNVTDVFNAMTAQMAVDFKRQGTLLAMKTLDPQDIAGSQAKFILAMQKYGIKASLKYNDLAKNYLVIFSEAEGISLGKASIDSYDATFNKVAYNKRMMGAGVYGYKKMLSDAGEWSESLSAGNRFYRQAVDNVGGDVAKMAMQQGRDTIVNNSYRRKTILGWSRKVNIGACTFCMMLATRNNYHEDTAGFKAHRKCGCSAEPVVDGWTPSNEALLGYRRFLGYKDDETEAPNFDLYMSKLEPLTKKQPGLLDSYSVSSPLAKEAGNYIPKKEVLAALKK
jgi:hypothetical protein